MKRKSPIKKIVITGQDVDSFGTTTYRRPIAILAALKYVPSVKKQLVELGYVNLWVKITRFDGTMETIRK